MELGNAIIVDRLDTLELGGLGAAAAAVYNKDVEIKALFEDPVSGEEHYLIRYPAGVKARLHRHTAAHTFVILQGHLSANGTIIGPGSYAHFPGGEPMRHEAAGDEPCLFVALFHGPFDVEVVGD